jgi:hypothetical protein
MADADPVVTARTQRRLLIGLRTLVNDTLAMRFVSQSGVDMPNEYAKVIADVSLIETPAPHTALRVALTPISDNLKHIKARLLLHLEPSVLNNVSAAERIRAETVIQAIDGIALQAGLDMQIAATPGSKGTYTDAGFRNR